MSKRMRPRNSYHNTKSYDDTLELVLELLEQSEEYEDAIVQPFIEAYEKLCKLYEKEFPFYFKNGVDNKKMNELLISLISGNGDFNTKISEVLDEIERQTRSLETQYLTAWLILDYELTAEATAQSIKMEPEKFQLWIEQNPVQQVIQKPWCKDNKTYIDRVREATQTMDKNLRTVIVQGIRRGWSKERMTQIFKNITGAAEYKARRLIRTETMAVWSKVTKDMYLEQGIEYVEIIGDAVCGGICTGYVGEVIPLKEAEMGDDLPPYHPNCCCSFCSYTEFVENSVDNSD